MAERLEPHEDLRALPRLIAAETDQARASLARTAREPVIAVHEARKSIKRARSGARLIRKADKAASRSLNAQGRQAAKALEKVRDADSLSQIAEGAAMRARDPEVAAALRAEAARARQAAKALNRTKAAREAEASLKTLSEAIRSVRIEADPDAAMREGLARAWRRTSKRLKQAVKDPGPETLHALRKRVKDWRHHATALKPVWPEGLKAKRKKTKKLADLLGLHHDLSRLIAVLESRDDEAAHTAAEAMKTERAALEDKALAKAGKVFKASPKKAARRLEAV
jgi:CHAD domain-containing protein